MTREHIWPRGIIRRVPEYNARYIGAHHKFVEAELTVKDVCATCNNGALSALDAYVCHLFDAQFVHFARPRRARSFVFDYEPLLRWLLKISYNSARANHTDVIRLKSYAGFIRLGGTLPPDVQLRLELVHPSKNPKHIPGSGSSEFIPPKSVRCSRAELPNCPVSDLTVRLVAVNSFYFWLVLPPPEVSAASLEDYLPGTVVSPSSSRLTTFSSRGMLELHRDWVLDSRAQQSMKAFRARNDG